MDPVFTLNHKCIQIKNSGGDAPSLWCKQVVYMMKTPVAGDITRDNTVLSGVMSRQVTVEAERLPPENANGRERFLCVYKGEYK